MYGIIQDGLFFRVVNEATGWRSSVYASPAQASVYILRKAGADAQLDALLAFTGRKGT